jgi:signal transduction histidine kinase
MVMKEGCVLCHGHLGFKVGDIRGGVSISIPLTPYLEAARESKTSLIFTHSIVWSIGILTIGLVSWRGYSQEREKRQAEEERQRMEEKLRHTQKLESLGVLAGGIAHDFNNILTSILGNTDLALDDLSPDSPAHDFIGEIQKGAKRAAELSHQMLAYSGRAKFVIENIDINEIIKEMAHMLEVSISKKHNIKYDLAENLPSIEVDINQIRQIIMNLILNASEAIGDNSGVISITTEAGECDKDCFRKMYLDDELPDGLYNFIQVADTGVGMDEETIKKIFDPFFTTKFTGRGLGMSAVLGIIRGHKGAINVESKPGKGTIFTVLLPPSGKESTTTKPDRQETAASWRGHGTILVVDDEEIVREVGKDMLEAIGFNVITAGDGQDAVEIFNDRSNEIDCVLLDLTMPRMNGEECFFELRKIRKDIRILIYSGYSKQETAQKFIDQEVNGFLEKPFQLKTLQDSMRKVFESA